MYFGLSEVSQKKSISEAPITWKAYGQISVLKEGNRILQFLQFIIVIIHKLYLLEKHFLLRICDSDYYSFCAYFNTIFQCGLSVNSHTYLDRILIARGIAD